MAKEDVINKKEKLLIEYLVADRDTFVKCFSILEDSYFEDPLNRVVSFIIEYFQKYKNVPHVDTIDAETGIELTERELHESDREYLLEEIEKHCRKAAMSNAILQGADLIEEDEDQINDVEELVRNALLVKLDPSIGTNVFEDPETRIEKTDINTDKRSSGIDSLDKIIGNLRRGELGLIYAPTSGGKSVMLANLTRNMAEQKQNAVVISLELNELLYSKRMDSILTDSDIGKHESLKSEISESLKSIKEDYGNITVKKMKFGTTVEDIRAYLLEYQLMMGHIPDVLIVDYLGLMGASSQRWGMNKYDIDEQKAFGLRDLIVEWNMYGFSAGQINREGYNIMDLTPAHCAGGISVVNASDWSVAMAANEEDRENNQVQLRQLKIRNHGFEYPETVYRDPYTLRMSGVPYSQKKQSNNDNKVSSSDLKDAKGKDKFRKAINKK